MLRRRLAIGGVAAAAILLGGRALSLLYDGYTWYDSLGARAIWEERMTDTALTIGAGFALAMLFALANLGFVARNVSGLTRARRIANVEFGEAVPPAQLRVAAIAISVGVGGGLTPLLPPWTAVAMARLGVDFREADPYLHHDLSFYVGWLPLERAIYAWAFALVAATAAIVLAAYVLASDIRLTRGQLRMTAPVRRHLGMLSAILLLLAAWSYRIDSFGLLASGGRDGAGFTYLDREWMLPGLLALSLATGAIAVTVAISAWMGQLRTSLVALMGAIALAAMVKEILPFVVLRSGSDAEQRLENAPYVATRADFTRRAFGAEMTADGDASSPYAALSAAPPVSLLRDSLVAPGAKGTLIVDDRTRDIAAPSLGSGLTRLAHAWALRDFGLLSNSVSQGARIVSVRDVGERIRRLYPLLAVGPPLRPFYRADTLYWAAALYSSSASYPLAERREIWGESRSYLHRAGTALVNARTGRVYGSIDIPPEPIAAGWIRKFGSARSLADAQAVQHALSMSTAGISAGTRGSGDTAFRAEVSRLYERMRFALAAGDLRAFGRAYDSLGALVRKSEK